MRVSGKDIQMLQALQPLACELVDKGFAPDDVAHEMARHFDQYADVLERELTKTISAQQGKLPSRTWRHGR